MRGNRPTDQAQTTSAAPAHLLDQPGLARAVLDGLRANVFVADPDLNLLYTNEKGSDTARALGQDVYYALRPRLVEYVDRGAPDTQVPVGASTIEAHTNRVTGPDGRLAGYVLTWEDITARITDTERARTLAGRLSDTQEVSAALQACASATEQMAASANEIARNASEASTTVDEAVTSVNAANHTMVQLRDASGKINEIVQTITAVAEQTNLLALNATIEAARAGELGKGFAVVAGEVKELSKQTKTATERITEMIDSVQELSGAAASAISQISTVVERVSRNQITIASAVEQQTATTKEISVNLSHAARRAEEIAAIVAANS